MMLRLSELLFLYLLGIPTCMSGGNDQKSQPRKHQKLYFKSAEDEVVGIPISVAPPHEQFILQMRPCEGKKKLRVNVKMLPKSKIRLHNRPLTSYRKYQRQQQIAGILMEAYKDLTTANDDVSNILKPDLFGREGDGLRLPKYERIKDWEETHAQIAHFHLRLVKNYIGRYKRRNKDDKIEALMPLQMELSTLSKVMEEEDIWNEAAGRTNYLPPGGARQLQRQREIRQILLDTYQDLKAKGAPVEKPTDIDNFPKLRQIRNWRTGLSAMDRLGRDHLKFVQKYIRNYEALGNKQKMEEMERLRSELAMFQNCNADGAKAASSEDSLPDLLDN